MLILPLAQLGESVHCPRAKTVTAAVPKARRFLGFRRPAITDLLPLETSAVVEATARDVQARKGAVMLRLWHHVGEEMVRAVLFEDFVIEGRPLGLIEAIVCTAQKRHWMGRLPRGLNTRAPEWPREVNRLERAFAYALTEVFGDKVSPMVRAAWQQTLRMLLAGAPAPAD